MFQKVGKKVMAIAKTMFWIECCIFGVIGIYLGALTSNFFVMLLSVAIGVVIKNQSHTLGRPLTNPPPPSF